MAVIGLEPVPEGDEGANPPDDLSKLHLVARKYSPVDEISAVVDSLQRWLPDHPDDTVAVLVPRNQRGFELVDVLRRRGIEVVDSLLRSTASTRFSARVLTQLLSYLSDPGSPSRLALLYKAWQRGEQAGARRERVSELLRKCGQVEDFIWPNPGQDWLEELDLEDTEPQVYTQLLEFRQLVRRWQEAILLPVDQMILTASQDLFTEPSQLALAHKLAALLRQAGQSHPSWRLPELTEELAVIARNERRFLGFSDDDTGFDPGQYRGKVVVATMHKAKGLEWDRVYLMSVNTYDFPSGLQGDRYISEKWFLRDSLNLEAETLAQLDALLSTDEYTWYQESEATHRARLDYVRERLRLFYVGITRAKKELVVTWNTGRRGELQPSTPLLALMDYVSSQETSNDL